MKIAKMADATPETVDEQRKMTYVTFNKIKEATGVTDVNEVIQRLSIEDRNNGGTTRRTNGIEQMSREYEALKSRVEELKYSGPAVVNKKMVDDREENQGQLYQIRTNKNQYERLASYYQC